MKYQIRKTITVAIASAACILLAGCAGAQPRTNVTAYPLKECLVSGNELGSMGDVVTENFQGREIKFCCKPCVKKFHADPEKYLARLQKAETRTSQ
jgi:hypothetical protein